MGICAGLRRQLRVAVSLPYVFIITCTFALHLPSVGIKNQDLWMCVVQGFELSAFRKIRVSVKRYLGPESLVQADVQTIYHKINILRKITR